MSVDRSLLPAPGVAGEQMHALMRELFPLNRSLTGDGVRTTLARLGVALPVTPIETPTGTSVFDWTAPNEWNVREAWIESPTGERIVDFASSNLHVLGYSAAVDATVSRAELAEHVFTHPSDPDLVPYRTSYYKEQWGFCMAQRVLESLPDGPYRVRIDASLEPGSVTYGECVLPGSTSEEFLLTTYVCHPSLANDNLSGVVLLSALGQALASQALRYTYRLLWSPGTIGPLCWLRNNRNTIDRVRHGLVLSCLGDPGGMTYKCSRRGKTEIDVAVAHVLRASGEKHTLLNWFPWGGDERQFCSPGFDLAMGALSRTPADHFPEYHSSADNPDFVKPEMLEASLNTCLDIIEVIEGNARYRNRCPYGEPQLGKRGLYRSVGGGSSQETALLWVLSLSDGTSTLLEISERSALPFGAIREAADRLLEHDLLEVVM